MNTQYILELCDTSGKHSPIVRFESNSPFMTTNIGERFDDEGWNRSDDVGVIASPEKPRRYTVHSIKHIVVPNAGGLIVKYCLNLDPFNGPSSPVWKDN